jgi:regulator of sirC expression with transglutaminase-like and TPR domain
MVSENEIRAMVSLLDDSDEEVRHHIEAQFLLMGSDAVPFLEHILESGTASNTQQDALLNLIHRIQFTSVKDQLELWKSKNQYDLLEGLLIINKYQYPDADDQKIINTIEEIKRDAWLMMHNDMSPLEQVKTINHILYSVYGFKGNTGNHADPHNSYISQVLDSKKGNQILLASIYSIIAQKLDVNILGVNLPQHFILAYVDVTDTLESENGIVFYINAFNNGFVFKRKDIDFFLRQLKIEARAEFYEPCTNIEIIQRVIRNLIHSYQQTGQKDKVDELYQLFDVLQTNTPSDML